VYLDDFAVNPAVNAWAMPIGCETTVLDGARIPRLPRLHAPGAFYHVILRGNDREALFGSHHDRVALNNIVAAAIERQQARLHLFCRMTNHLHALVQIGEAPLAVLMHRIARPYARYRQRRWSVHDSLIEP